MENENYQQLKFVMQPGQRVLKCLQQQLNEEKEVLCEPQENIIREQKDYCNPKQIAIQSSKSRILVVDDSEENRQILEYFLGKCGYDVVLASNGYQAWYVVQNENLDLVLTDICMPGVSGNELAQYIKSHSKALPIIAITGSSWLAGGYFDKIISKPLRLHALLDSIKFHLAKVSTFTETDAKDR